jgi:hypothetical protein
MESRRMKKLTLALTPLLLSLQSLQAQEAVIETPPQAVPLTVVECEEELSFGGAPFDAELWAARLSESDQGLRMAAFEAVTETARERVEVFRTLQVWARDQSRGELAWTARLALREIEQVQKSEREPWGFGTSDLDDLRIGSQGPSQDRYERLLFEKFDQLQRRMAQGLTPGAAPGEGIVPRVFRLDFGPEGWRINTRSLGAEGEVHQHWEAESIEALLSAHPELEEEFPVLGSLRLRFGLPGVPSTPIVPPIDEGPRADVLGVECRPLTSNETEAMDLSIEDRGLLVARTVPGSIADELGVRRGDILMSLNGTRLGDPIDITESLALRAPDAPIQLLLLDTQGQERALVWSPKPLRELEQAR